MKDEGQEVRVRNLQYPNATTYAKRYSRKHIFRAGAIVWIKHEGKDYYLVFRSYSRPNRGVQVPGGRIERYENIAQTVIREIKEETGLSTKIVCPLGFAYFEDPDRQGSNLQIYYILRPTKKIQFDKKWIHIDKDNSKQKLECWFEPIEKDADFLSVGHDKVVEMFRDWLEEHKPDWNKTNYKNMNKE